MRIFFIISLILLAFSSACSRPDEHSTVDADAIGRHIIGPALSLPSEISDKNSAEVIASLRLTREKAWKIFGQVIADETLTIQMPDGETKSTQIPRFMTWYSLEDTNRLFAFGLESLTPEAQAAGLPLSSDQWVSSEQRLLTELKSLPKPVHKKWETFFSINPELSREAILGATGLPRTLFNRELIQAGAKQYASLQECFPNQVKPASHQASPPCFKEKLPSTSFTIKTNWLNTASGFRQYATDGEALTSVMNSADASWDNLQEIAPVPENIVKATMNGKSFVLGGLHIVSKEFDDWIWISAWWSAKPNEDFGEDRPDFIQKLGAPWNQYKICAVSSYVQDAKELDEIAKSNPSLAAAYRAVLNESGASWCSNPYIERGINNQKTNCIGCHQFAGTDVSQMDIISDASRFPHFGNTKQREDFPADYIWSATQGQISWLATLNSLRFPVH